MGKTKSDRISKPLRHRPADAAKPRLGELLIKKNLVGPEQLLAALEEQAQTEDAPLIGVILMRRGLVSETEILQNLALQRDLPYYDIRNLEVLQEIAGLLPREIALHYTALPVEQRREELVVAMMDPLDEATAAEIQKSVSDTIVPAFACRVDLQNAVQRVYNNLVNSSAEAREFFDLVARMVKENSFNAEEVLQRLLLLGNALGAATLHIHFLRFSILIQMRINGILHPLPIPVRRFGAGQIATLRTALSRRARIDDAKRHIPQFGTMELRQSDGAFAIRVSTLPVMDGDKFTLHFLRRFQFKRFENLELSDEDRELLVAGVRHSSGIIVVASSEPTERAAMLYALLSRLSRDRRGIVTIEDPIMAKLPFAAQCQIGRDGPMTLESALAGAKASDADVTMISDLKPIQLLRPVLETFSASGLCLLGINAADAIQAVYQLLGAVSNPVSLALLLNIVLSRRMIPRMCPNCRHPHPQMEELNRQLHQPADAPLYSSAGCSKCFNTGREGMVAVHEMFIIDDTVKHQLTGNPSVGGLKESLNSTPSHGFRADALVKCRQGLIHPEDALWL